MPHPAAAPASSPAYRDDPAASHLALREETESFGRLALRVVGLPILARQAEQLHAALLALQADAAPGAGAIDSDAIEDLHGLLARLAAERRAA